MPSSTVTFAMHVFWHSGTTHQCHLHLQSSGTSDASLPVLLPLHCSISPIAPVIPLQKGQMMRRKQETLHRMACQSTLVMTVTPSVRLFHFKGRSSPLAHFTAASVP